MPLKLVKQPTLKTAAGLFLYAGLFCVPSVLAEDAAISNGVNSNAANSNIVNSNIVNSSAVTSTNVQTTPRRAPLKEVAAPPNALTLYVNGMHLPGWEPQPFYMWTQLAAPAVEKTDIASPSAPAANAAPVATATPVITPAATAAPEMPVAVSSVFPKLPGGDAAREAILGEYRLSGFFRKSFKRGQRSIYIDVYEFQNADGAYGAYNYLRRGSTTVLPRGDAASEDDQSISLVQGKTFLSIYGTSQDDDETKEVLTKVANEAVKYIVDKGLQPAILGRLPRLERLHGSEKIVMGPNSIRRFFPAPFLNSLVLEPGRIVGCVADYQIQEPAKERLKLMVLSFRSPQDAAGNYQKFLEAIGVAHNDDVSTLINQPINVFKSGHTYVAIEQRGADLLMITGARKRFSPALVLRQVR